MERQSFEDQEIASILNQSFVCIKVDREEMPDVDKIYMEAVTTMQGQGGWPLSAFLTPELKPFYGGTYFPPEAFKALLQNVSEAWITNRSSVEEASEEVFKLLQLRSRTAASEELDQSTLEQAFIQLKTHYDSQYGGFGPAPKFPPSAAIRFLFRYANRTRSSEALEIGMNTLRAMATGGIYDQIGGGFHRYSTDEKWLVPHFEKMLYDNALLVTCYIEAFQLGGEELFREVVKETLDYVLREMQDPGSGGFYSAQDAGDVGAEGEYYVWNEQELRDLLTAPEFEALVKIYEVPASGNFENGTTILAMQNSVPLEEVEPKVVNSLKKKLLNARKDRKAPHIDNKILSSWNGLITSAFCRGYQLIGDERYKEAACKAGSCIKTLLTNDSGLLRSFCDGEAKHPGYIGDYAYCVAAAIDLYESTFDPKWLEWAEDLQSQQDEKFWDESEGGYFFTDGSDANEIVRTKEHLDGALPNPSAVSAMNLTRLYHLCQQEQYHERATHTLESLSAFAARYPSANCTALCVLELNQSDVEEIALIGSLEEQTVKFTLDCLQESFKPNMVLACSNGEPVDYPRLLQGKTRFEDKASMYLCRNRTCREPASTTEEVKKLLSN